MKINIGKYSNWFGPYQFFDLLQHFGVSEDKCFELGEKYGYMLLPFFNWIDKFKHTRHIKIQIDNYDVWSLDHTLSHIIIPALKLLKEVTHGAPMIDNEDLPKRLRPTKAQTKKFMEDGTTDKNFFKRWDYVLDEMIWAFEQSKDEEWESQYHINDKFDKGGYNKHIKRMKKGHMLFGKYYMNLWD